MLTILRASLRAGRVTKPYPEVPDAAEGYRGRPAIDPNRCDASGACVEACPSSAIGLTDRPAGGQRWELDLARCLFCGLCVEACPTGALRMTQDFELAVRDRRDLILTATPGGGTAADSPGADAEPADAPPNRAHLNDRIRRVLRRSLHIRHVDTGSDNSTDWEIAALLNPIHDVQRLGIDFVASPRHADLLLVTGAVTRHLEPALQRAYQAMPRPGLVVAAGTEACGGGLLAGSYAVAGGVDRCLPVDVYIPGDPPRPQALIQGLLLAVDRIEQKLRRSTVERAGADEAPRGTARPLTMPGETAIL